MSYFHSTEDDENGASGLAGMNNVFPTNSKSILNKNKVVIPPHLLAILILNYSSVFKTLIT